MMHFGTDGIRGRFDEKIFSPEKLYKLGYALGRWLSQKLEHPKIIVIADTRASGDYIKASLSSGLLLHKLHLFDCGVLPTPAAYVLMQEYQADAALIISASHNPAHDNGIKIMLRTGKLN